MEDLRRISRGSSEDLQRIIRESLKDIKRISKETHSTSFQCNTVELDLTLISPGGGGGIKTTAIRSLAILSVIKLGVSNLDVILPLSLEQMDEKKLGGCTKKVYFTM